MTTTVLVTGSTDGIGKETARQLAERGARVILHGRSEGKVAATKEALESAVGGARFETAVGDFGKLSSVRALAADVRERFGRDLDVLLNNAGVYASERKITEDGHDLTWQVNHLAPFLLTLELLPSLRARPAARVVNVSSIAHTRGRIALDDPSLASGFDGYRAYAQSKLANVLFTQELARRLEKTSVVTTCLHPGVIQTKLLKAGFGMTTGADLAEGAATSVYLALDPFGAKANGAYFVACEERQPATRDAALAGKLWELSERQVGLR